MGLKQARSVDKYRRELEDLGWIKTFKFIPAQKSSRRFGYTLLFPKAAVRAGVEGALGRVLEGALERTFDSADVRTLKGAPQRAQRALPNKHYEQTPATNTRDGDAAVDEMVETETPLTTKQVRVAMENGGYQGTKGWVNTDPSTLATTQTGEPQFSATGEGSSLVDPEASPGAVGRGNPLSTEMGKLRAREIRARLAGGQA